MTTRKWLWIGFGTWLAVLMALGVVILASLRHIETDWIEQSDIARPRSAAARQMEINLLGYALAVRTSLHLGAPRFLEDARREAERVEAAIAEYARFARTERQRMLTVRFRSGWQEYRSLADRVLRNVGPPQSSESMAQLRIALERMLADEIQVEANQDYARHRQQTSRDLQVASVSCVLLLVAGLTVGGATTAAAARGVLRVQQALHRETAQLHAAFQAIADGVIVYDASGMAMFINGAQLRLVEFTSPAEFKRDLTELARIFEIEELSGRPVPEELWPVRRVMAGESLRELELRVRRRDTRREWIISFSGEPIRDQNGVQFLSLVVSRDVSERKQAEAQVRQLNATLEARVAQRTAQLAEANLELQAFAYTVSHDLRAPLRGIQGFAQALVEDFAPGLGAEGREYCTRIAAAGQRMEALIDDLLAYSRLARQEITLKAVDLDDIVAAALHELAPQLRSSRAQVHVERPLGVCLGQRPILLQVVQNLLSNALKFVAPGVNPEVHVAVRTCGERIRLLVRDRGVGIEPRNLQRVFQVFERLHGDDAYPGSGVGLAIVKRGIERLGGRVGVESVAGSGSLFWIELPKA